MKSLRIVLALVFLAFATAARAEPKYGGCIPNSSTCFAPSVSISLVSLSLDDFHLNTTVSPGVGYGVTFWTDQWFQTGISGYLSFRDTSTGQQLVPSLVLSFAEYMRMGVGYQIGGEEKPFLLIGMGTDFGQSK